ncbi:xylulokinase [Peribacillus sp. FSL K6-1552]|uniref:xylulokinase n=1 Tax=Peribacillus sp. FSL K6-1552 TaxID=2954514 RepID=UPI0030FA9EE8
MKYVIGIDLGTSSVKVILVSQEGEVKQTVTKEYPIIHEKPGYSEQDPEQWVLQTLQALTELVQLSAVPSSDIEGLSFSGQMHGLVLLNREDKVIRPAILWNDTRSTSQCLKIKKQLGSRLLEITKNPALEGLTLPKLLWVQENEEENFRNISVFLLPKDYLRFRLTGRIASEYSDAAGTLLLNIENQSWSTEIIQSLDLPKEICPPLVESGEFVGNLLPEIAGYTGLSVSTKVFAGGADNACGAVGAGILSKGKALCSIGTSGVLLAYDKDSSRTLNANVHFFNHIEKDSYYKMGVTLAAGYSLRWFKQTFMESENFSSLLEKAGESSVGANYLLFTPYLIGERTPHADSKIRGTFTGINGTHRKQDFVRAVIEGIVFSIHETLQVFRSNGPAIDTIISIGGGANSDLWLQIQADIFDAKIIKLNNDQGPGMGAAMIAATGLGWFNTLKECASKYVSISYSYYPIQENVNKYKKLYQLYKDIYTQTASINHQLFDLNQINNQTY